MYLTHMAALAVTAFRAGIEHTMHPVLAAKDVWVGPEFPAVEANYPGVWVTYDPDPTLSVAGLGHVEYRIGSDGEARRGTRWTFSGTITATVVALSRRERDELMDEVVRLIAFGTEHPATAVVKQTLESNDFIAVNALFGEFRLLGLSDSGRTPWGSDEAVYEGSVALTVQGEFISDVLSPTILVPLSAIIVHEPEVIMTPPRNQGVWH